MKKFTSLLSTVLAAAGCATAVEEDMPPPSEPKEESLLLKLDCGIKSSTFETDAVSIHFPESKRSFFVTPKGYSTSQHQFEDCIVSIHINGGIERDDFKPLSIACDFRTSVETKVHFNDVATGQGVFLSELSPGRRLVYFPLNNPDTLSTISLSPKEKAFEAQCTIQALSL